MGNKRYGYLPKRTKWQKIVEGLAEYAIGNVDASTLATQKVMREFRGQLVERARPSLERKSHFRENSIYEFNEAKRKYDVENCISNNSDNSSKLF